MRSSKRGSINRNTMRMNSNNSFANADNNEQVFKPMKKSASLTRAMTDSEVRDFLTQNIHYIIKLQSWYRGNKARRRILFLRSKQIGLKKYLNRVEV